MFQRSARWRGICRLFSDIWPSPRPPWDKLWSRDSRFKQMVECRDMMRVCQDPPITTRRRRCGSAPPRPVASGCPSLPCAPGRAFGFRAAGAQATWPMPTAGFRAIGFRAWMLGTMGVRRVFLSMARMTVCSPGARRAKGRGLLGHSAQECTSAFLQMEFSSALRLRSEWQHREAINLTIASVDPHRFVGCSERRTFVSRHRVAQADRQSRAEHDLDHGVKRFARLRTNQKQTRLGMWHSGALTLQRRMQQHRNKHEYLPTRTRLLDKIVQGRFPTSLGVAICWCVAVDGARLRRRHLGRPSIE